LPSSPWVARCVDVVKTYRTSVSEVRALAGVSASFPTAALTAVVGPSGSGKSTLLRLIAGMDRPDGGTVEVAGMRVERASGSRLRRLRRRDVGFVFQRPSDNFLPYLTVGEHLRLAARRAARPPLLEPAAMVDTLGLSHRLDHHPEQLSGGEQQRAAFAQVLMAGTDVVVADEPTAELDSASARGLMATLHRVVEAGVTFVVATHDPVMRRRADAVLELEHGRSVRAAGASAGRAMAGPSPFARPGLRGSAPTLPQDPAPDAQPLVDVVDLVKSYRRGDEVVHALDGVTLSLPAGGLVGLVGRSGSGKTTLLNVVGGWEEPDRGRVAWSDGVPIGDRPAWADVAVLPQRFGLLEELSVRANVEYPARLAGRLDGERVDDLLDGLGLTELQDRQPRETSVGEQQRTALARAMVLRPRLLLADEATGHQDTGWARAVLEALRSAAAEGTCCLVATHDEDVARGFDRVFAMADGRIGEPAPRSAG
jgi:putative ABC transport system ATP-binding protein